MKLGFQLAELQFPVEHLHCNNLWSNAYSPHNIFVMFFQEQTNLGYIGFMINTLQYVSRSRMVLLERTHYEAEIVGEKVLPRVTSGEPNITGTYS
jgi:hypothetical protein